MLTPLTASSLNFLLLCLQVSHNSFPSQADSCSFILFPSLSAQMLLLFSLSFLLLTQPSLLDLGCKGLHGIVDHIHYKKPQCFFPQTKEELWFFCTCSCALTRGTSWLCSGHLALHSCAPAWHQLLAKVHGQPWGGDSLPLHSKVSKKHSGNVKGVLLITHGNSGIRMPG